MQIRGSRRAILASLGAMSLSGCTVDTIGEENSNRTGEPDADPSDSGPADTDDESSPDPFDYDLPDECPVTQGLDVEWPTEIDGSEGLPFLLEYEEVFHREVVIEWDPELPFDTYYVSPDIARRPTGRGDGYVVKLWTSGSISKPGFILSATVSDRAPGGDVVSVGEFDHPQLEAFLERTVEDGAAERRLSRQEHDIERYHELFAFHFDAYDPRTEPGDPDILAVDVAGTLVELSVRIDGHLDVMKPVWYYVDARTIWRSFGGKITEIGDGELLECRT